MALTECGTSPTFPWTLTKNYPIEDQRNRRFPDEIHLFNQVLQLLIYYWLFGGDKHYLSYEVCYCFTNKINFMIKWNRNRGSAWKPFVYMCQYSCTDMWKPRERQYGKWGRGIFQIIPSECFITRCLHITYINFLKNRLYLTYHLPKTRFKKFYCLK